MFIINNMFTFIQSGIISISKLDITSEQHEYLRNRLIMAKCIAGSVPYIQRLKSLEFKYENEKYITQLNYKPKTTKPLHIKLRTSNGHNVAI